MNESAIKLLRDLADALEKKERTALTVHAEIIPNHLDAYGRVIYRLSLDTVPIEPTKEC